MDNWVSIFETTEEFMAERTKQLLEDGEIPAVILNQLDSSYKVFGVLKVMVNREDQEKAEEIIKECNDRE